MKKLLALIIALLMLCACAPEEPEKPFVPEEPQSETEISEPEESKNPVSEEQNEPSPEEDAALQEWVESLEPIEVYDTKNVYPWVIGEIFEIIMESEPEENKATELKNIEVCGGENEFFVDYTYSCKAENPGHLLIRVRMNNDGLYTLVARGGGPLGYGLQKTDITLDDIVLRLENAVDITLEEIVSLEIQYRNYKEIKSAVFKDEEAKKLAATLFAVEIAQFDEKKFNPVTGGDTKYVIETADGTRIEIVDNGSITVGDGEKYSQQYLLIDTDYSLDIPENAVWNVTKQ